MNRAERILIADDEPNVRLVVRTALEQCGYDLDEAEDGETPRGRPHLRLIKS